MLELSAFLKCFFGLFVEQEYLMQENVFTVGTCNFCRLPTPMKKHLYYFNLLSDGFHLGVIQQARTTVKRQVVLEHANITSFRTASTQITSPVDMERSLVSRVEPLETQDTKPPFTGCAIVKDQTFFQLLSSTQTQLS